MTKLVAIYCRVSTKTQDTEHQHNKLCTYFDRVRNMPGWEDAELVASYEDHSSGAKDSRPGLKALREALVRREANTVLVVGLDRLARNSRHIANLLHEWDQLGVTVVSLREAVDTTTPMGRALVQLAAIFAELERELIRERVAAAVATARKRGKHIGQKPLPKSKRDALADLVAEGVPEAEICTRLDVGKGSVYRARKALQAST